MLFHEYIWEWLPDFFTKKSPPDEEKYRNTKNEKNYIQMRKRLFSILPPPEKNLRKKNMKTQEIDRSEEKCLGFIFSKKEKSSKSEKNNPTRQW